MLKMGGGENRRGGELWKGGRDPNNDRKNVHELLIRGGSPTSLSEESFIPFKLHAGTRCRQGVSVVCVCV